MVRRHCCKIARTRCLLADWPRRFGRVTGWPVTSSLFWSGHRLTGDVVVVLVGSPADRWRRRCFGRVTGWPVTSSLFWSGHRLTGDVVVVLVGSLADRWRRRRFSWWIWRTTIWSRRDWRRARAADSMLRCSASGPCHFPLALLPLTISASQFAPPTFQFPLSPSRLTPVCLH